MILHHRNVPSTNQIATTTPNSPNQIPPNPLTRVFVNLQSWGVLSGAVNRTTGKLKLHRREKEVGFWWQIAAVRWSHCRCLWGDYWIAKTYLSYLVSKGWKSTQWTFLVLKISYDVASAGLDNDESKVNSACDETILGLILFLAVTVYKLLASHVHNFCFIWIFFVCQSVRTERLHFSKLSFMLSGE